MDIFCTGCEEGLEDSECLRWPEVHFFTLTPPLLHKGRLRSNQSERLTVLGKGYCRDACWDIPSETQLGAKGPVKIERTGAMNGEKK